MTWKHFPRYWAFVSVIHRSPVDSLHKGLVTPLRLFRCCWSKEIEQTVKLTVISDAVTLMRRHCNVLAVLDGCIILLSPFTTHESHWFLTPYVFLNSMSTDPVVNEMTCHLYSDIGAGFTCVKYWIKIELGVYYIKHMVKFWISTVTHVLKLNLLQSLTLSQIILCDFLNLYVTPNFAFPQIAWHWKPRHNEVMTSLTKFSLYWLCQHWKLRSNSGQSNCAYRNATVLIPEVLATFARLSWPLDDSWSTQYHHKANLRDLIAATGLVILLKLDSNHRFFSPCDLEI